MVNPATYSDLEARWRPLSAEEQSVANALLEDAWQILLARVTALSARLGVVAPATSPALDPALVVAVECAMVLRVLRNPDGKRQESIDDYSWTRDNSVSAGTLYVSDEELALLSPATPGLGSAFVVSLGG